MESPNVTQHIVTCSELSPISDSNLVWAREDQDASGQISIAGRLGHGGVGMIDIYLRLPDGSMSGPVGRVRHSGDIARMVEPDDLGRIVLASLDDRKALAAGDVVALAEKTGAALTAGYPRAEIDSWPAKMAEARAVTADAAAPAPILRAEADALGVAVADVVGEGSSRRARHSRSAVAQIAAFRQIAQAVDRCGIRPGGDRRSAGGVQGANRSSASAGFSSVA